MTLLEIILTGLSLSMDAFTISICKGLNNNKKNIFIVALFFGFFQFIMPILGYYLGTIFNNKITNYNSYFSIILLIIIGIIIYHEKELDHLDYRIKFKELIILSLLTSTDAFVIGISFAFIKINIMKSAIIIGMITFIMCLIGLFIGFKLQNKLKKYSNKIAGTTLIIISIKMFIENILK